MDWIRHKVEVRWTCCTQVEEYMTAAGRHSAASSHLRELSWRKYVHHVRAFSEQYRKRVDDHVTRTMRRWTAKVGSLADNDWLAFALNLFYIHTRQAATLNSSERRRRRIEVEFARFLDLIDVDGVLAWNATVIDR